MPASPLRRRKLIRIVDVKYNEVRYRFMSDGTTTIDRPKIQWASCQNNTAKVHEPNTAQTGITKPTGIKKKKITSFFESNQPCGE